MSQTPIGDLIAAIRADLAAIGRDISALAKAEFKRDGVRLGVGLGALIAGGFLATLVIVLLVIAVAQGLIAAGLPPWAAYLVDAGIFLVVVALLVLLGVGNLKKVGPPTATITAVQDSIAALEGKTPEQAAADRAAAAAESDARAKAKAAEAAGKAS
jgi:hypothetical protein